MKKYRSQILYGIAILLIALMHTILLDKIPRGFDTDEVGAAVDAYCLGHFGVDRWLKSWPVYFINYRDGQNALYTYLLVPMLLIFGKSAFAVRSVIAVSAIVMAIAGAKTAELIYDDKKTGPAFLFLYAVMPVFTITLRFGLESHLMMSIASLVIYSLIRAVKKETVRSYILFGFFAGLILYTYAIAYTVVPIFLLLSLIYLIIKKKMGIKRFLGATVPFAVLASPLLLEQIINRYDLPEMKLGPFTITRLYTYRIGEIMTDDFFKKIIAGIKSTFFFDDLTYNSIPKFGNFYYISVPFLVIGIAYCFVKLIKSMKKDEQVSLYAFPLFFWIAYTLFSGFMANKTGYTNITRMNGVLASLILFVFIGIKAALGLLKKEKIQKAGVCALSLCYCVFFVFFARFYFTKFDSYAYPYKWLFFENYDKEIFEFLEDPANGYTDNQVFLPWVYTYYLWAVNPDPEEVRLKDCLPEDREIFQIGRYRMDGGIDLSSEYVVYKYGYTEESIAYMRSLHFNEYETEHFILFLDPLHDNPFFGENVVLGSDGGKDLILTKSYVSDIGNGQLAFYGWIDIPEDFGQCVNISMRPETGEVFEAEILADTYDSGRTVCFQFVMSADEFFNASEGTFTVEGSDESGKAVHTVRCVMK